MRASETKAAAADAMIADLAYAPGYLVKVASSRGDFLKIGRVVSRWDAGRDHVRVCVYLSGKRSGTTVVSLRPSANDAVLDVLVGMLERWGPPSVARVADVDVGQLSA